MKPGALTPSPRAIRAACCVLLAAAPALAGDITYYRDAPPRITEQPASVTVEVGQTITLKVTAEVFKSHTYPTTWDYSWDADLEPKYQWLRNNVHVPGATSATLTIPNAQTSHAGTYIVVLNNKRGHTTSSPAIVTVIVPILPVITRQPASVTRNEGETATLEVAAVGVPAPTFRWRKNGGILPGATSPQLTLGDLDATDAGTYDVLVTNSRGTVISGAASLMVLSDQPDAGRAATSTGSGPRSVHVNVGEAASFTAGPASGSVTYQWKKNGTAIAGATQRTFRIERVAAADMGFYSVTTSSEFGVVESAPATLTVATTGTSRLANLSTRAYVPAGGSLTPGFTLRGSRPKELLVRAVGPTLARFGVADAVRDPRFEIVRAGATRAVLANDDWMTGSGAAALGRAAAAVGGFALDENSRDAAVLATFEASGSTNYTVRIAAAAAESGVVLAELYDTDLRADGTRLAAVSTLAHTGAAERMLVAGITVLGTAPKRLLVRAVGPGLAPFGVTDVLAQPKLTVTSVTLNRPIATNDGWNDAPALVSAAAAVGAFPFAPGSRDAAMVITVPPGAYTVEVTGAAGDEGTALLEIYEAP